MGCLPKVLGDTDAETKTGAVIEGLYLEGARWDHQEGRLAESQPRQLHDVMPRVSLIKNNNLKKILKI